jgi:hypothetical protein
VRRFLCPCCGSLFLVPEGSEGAWFTCPQTGTAVEVRETDEAQTDDWPALAHVFVLWGCLRWRASRRKTRLFACACLRRLEHLLEEGYQDTLRDYEQFADEVISEEELASRMESARTVPYRPQRWPPRVRIACEGMAGVLAASRTDLTTEMPTPGADDVAVRRAFSAGLQAAAQVGRWASDAEDRALCDLLLDLFGPRLSPQAPVRPEWLAWNGGTVVAMAQHIYDGWAFGDLPFLADALEEAGCDDPILIEHCRGPGLHTRGCWVIDALLKRQ